MLAAEKEVRFKVLKHQEKFLYSKARYSVNSGGVGSGKTYSIILKTFRLISEYPGILILIGAQTFPLLRDTTLREFLAICPPEIINEHNKSTHTIKIINSAEILFRPLYDPDILKSLNLGAAGVEEMSDIKESIFNMLRTRMRQKGMPGCIYGATNAGTLTNYVYRHFIEKPIPDSEVIYSETTSNPHLPAGYLEDMEGLKETNPDYHARMVRGIWGRFSGGIYDFDLGFRLLPLPKNKDWAKMDPKERAEFIPPVTYKDAKGEEIQVYDRLIGGIDFGFEHPTAFLIIGIIGEKFYLIEELYERRLTAGDITQALKKRIDRYLKPSLDYTFGEPARPEIIEDLKRAQIRMRLAKKAVFEGIMYLKTLIKGGRLYVNRECTNTLKEMDSYVWDDKNLKEVPLKINDDCMDALRYALYSDHKKFKTVVVDAGGDLY